ncbi:MAG: nitrilase-related carbon-nitrogen hydrolase, partial [Hyphomicrobiales bacterium]
MRITVVQTNAGSNRDANLAQVRRLVGAAVAADRPDLVVLPEMMAFMGGSIEDRRESAEKIPGGVVYRALADLAREHRIILHGGSFYEAAPQTELIYNTTVVFDRAGAELARYRKIHLFDVTTPGGQSYRESDVVGRGGDIVTYDADGTKFGCSIC